MALPREPYARASGALRARRCSFVLHALCCVLAAGCAPETEVEPTARRRLQIDREIRRLVESGGRDLALPDTSGLEETWARLADFYRHRRHRPVWSRGLRVLEATRRLATSLERTALAGLDPRDYASARIARACQQAEGPTARGDSLGPRRLAELDVLATYACLRASAHLRDGRVPRAALDPDWGRDSARAAESDAAVAALGHDPAARFAELEPRHDGYRLLRGALVRLREVAAAGGWSPIGEGPRLARGAAGPRVAALIRRLAASGDLEGPVPDSVYDEALERAVGDVQERLGLPRSGAVGEATRAALDVPVERRIRQIELNLERWRWLPDTLGRHRLEVNIPAYRIELLREGRVTHAMRVVVGKRTSPTPVFSDRVAYLEINPTWTMPSSVVCKEIAPAYQRDRRYFEKHALRVISVASAARDTIDPREAPWERACTDSFLHLIVQDSGPENPLGRIKLMCPNEYDVYLHDTPQRGRFADAVRDHSHGCVRLEHAVELADSVLNGTPGDRLAVDSLVAIGAWKRVGLRASVPVHFLYWTAWADSAGHVSFRDDVYGLDRRLDDALTRHATSSFALNPGVQISAFWAAAEARARARRETRAAKVR